MDKLLDKQSKLIYSFVLILMAIALVLMLAVNYKYKVIMVVTDSMEPAVMVNSLSIIDKRSIEDINIGDIVMYQSHVGFKVTHRVVEIDFDKNELELYTKGDNNKNRDIYPITKDNFIGKIIYTNNDIAKYISTDRELYSVLDYGTLIVIMTGITFVLGVEIVLVTKGIRYILRNKKK